MLHFVYYLCTDATLVPFVLFITVCVGISLDELFAGCRVKYFRVFFKIQNPNYLSSADKYLFRLFFFLAECFLLGNFLALLPLLLSSKLLQVGVNTWFAISAAQTYSYSHHCKEGVEVHNSQTTTPFQEIHFCWCFLKYTATEQ